MQFKYTLLTTLAATVAADFSTPAAGGGDAGDDLSKDPIYPFGSQVNLQWDSDLPRISLILWQKDNSALETILGNVSNTGSYNWKVNTTKDYQSQTASNGEVFFLSIFQPGQTSPAFSSRYFNITAPTTTSTSSSATSSATQSSTSGASSSSATSTSTATPNPATAASSDSSTSSSSSSNSTALGAGLGVGLGVPLLAGIAALIWFLRRRKARQAVGIMPQSEIPQGGAAGGAPGAAYKAVPATETAAGGYYQPQEKTTAYPQQQTGPMELMGSASLPRYEMDGTAMAATGGQARVMHEMPETQA